MVEDHLCFCKRHVVVRMTLQIPWNGAQTSVLSGEFVLATLQKD